MHIHPFPHSLAAGFRERSLSRVSQNDRREGDWDGRAKKAKVLRTERVMGWLSWSQGPRGIL